MGLGDVSRLAGRNEGEISLFNTEASTHGLACALITPKDGEIFIKLRACAWLSRALGSGASVALARARGRAGFLFSR